MAAAAPHELAAADVASGQLPAKKRRKRTLYREEHNIEAWHVLDTLPRAEALVGSAAAAAADADEGPEPTARHSGHWVERTHGVRALFWHSETQTPSLRRPAAGLHFFEAVADGAEFDAMWAAAERCDSRWGESEDAKAAASAGDSEDESVLTSEASEWGSLDHIAASLAASAPGGSGVGAAGGGGSKATKRALRKEAKEAARMQQLVSELRTCVRQRYVLGAAPAAAEGEDDEGGDSGTASAPSLPSEAAIEAVAIDCATMLNSLVGTVLQLRNVRTIDEENTKKKTHQSKTDAKNEAKKKSADRADKTAAPPVRQMIARVPTASAVSQGQGYDGKGYDEAEQPYMAVLAAARLIGLPEAVLQR